jgi:hypothetical protein
MGGKSSRQRINSMAFIMMPMVTAAINALPGRLASHGNAFLNTMRQLAGPYCDANSRI